MTAAGVVLDLGAGRAVVGDRTIDVAPAGPPGALRVGALVLRPLEFGERSRVVSDASAARPGDLAALAAAVLAAAGSSGPDGGGQAGPDGGTRPGPGTRAALEALAMHLAGARTHGAAPGFAATAALASRGFGWGADQVLHAAADVVDRLVDALAPEAGDDGGWNRIVLTGPADTQQDALPDAATVRDALARDLLTRAARPLPGEAAHDPLDHRRRAAVPAEGHGPRPGGPGGEAPAGPSGGAPSEPGQASPWSDGDRADGTGAAGPGPAPVAGRSAAARAGGPPGPGRAGAGPSARSGDVHHPGAGPGAKDPDTGEQHRSSPGAVPVGPPRRSDEQVAAAGWAAPVAASAGDLAPGDATPWLASPVGPGPGAPAPAASVVAARSWAPWSTPRGGEGAAPVRPAVGLPGAARDAADLADAIAALLDDEADLRGVSRP